MALSLDAAGTVAAWDFARDKKAPAATLRLRSALPAAGAAPAKCCALELAPALQGAAHGAARRDGGAAADGPGGGGFVVAFSDGSAQWHAAPPWLCEAQAGDEDALQELTS